MGIGFYFPAILATALVLGILSVFRRIEAWMPSESYAYHYIRFDRTQMMSEEEVRAFLAQYGFSVENMSYRITRDGRFFEYRMVIRTTDRLNTARLAAALGKLELVREFRISPTGD
jgi:putative Mg2+ transporter-C (MgtC) family protein